MIRWSRTFLVCGAITALAGGAVRLAAQGGGPSAALPAQANAEFDGDLEVLVEDLTTSARTLHVLRTADGQRVQLQLPGNRPDLVTGQRVRARGRLTAGTLALSSTADVQVLSAPAVPNTFGEQRTIVILVNFTDKATEPYTPATAASVTFNQTSNYFLENSYGQTWLSGAVTTKWYTIASSSTTCDYNTIAAQADAAASNDGVNLSAYTRRVYGFPNNACSWWGLGTVGGNPSRAWINGSYTLKVVGHELGHNLGDHHSHSLQCDTAGCVLSEYGDTHDIMGNPSSGHLNAFQKERLGWLNYGSQPTIQTITAPGDYWIEGMSAPSAGGPKALRVLRGLDASNRRLYYDIEARVRTNADANITPGVLVHTATEGVNTSSNMVDLAPLTTAFDSVLDPGQAFADEAAGLFVTTLWTSATGAMVNVNFQAPPCTTQAPTVTLSPGGTRWATVSAATSYTLSVRNNDSWSCGPASFDLSASVPTGWTSSFGTSPLQVASGASASTSLVVSSDPSASGAYTFQVSASRPGPSAGATGSISIVTALDVGVSAASSSSGQYTLTATVAAGGQPAAGAVVSFRVTDPTGAMTTMAATASGSGVATVRFKPARRTPGGLYQVRATATFNGLSGIGNTMFVK